MTKKNKETIWFGKPNGYPVNLITAKEFNGSHKSGQINIVLPISNFFFVYEDFIPGFHSIIINCSES